MCGADVGDGENESCVAPGRSRGELVRVGGREKVEGRQRRRRREGYVQYLVLLVGCGLVGKQCLHNCARARFGSLVQCSGPLLICSVHIHSMLQQSFQQRH